MIFFLSKFLLFFSLHIYLHVLLSYIWYSLSLLSPSYTGTLPPQWSAMTSLKNVYLYGNSLSGKCLTWWIPSFSHSCNLSFSSPSHTYTIILTLEWWYAESIWRQLFMSLYLHDIPSSLLLSSPHTDSLSLYVTLYLVLHMYSLDYLCSLSSCDHLHVYASCAPFIPSFNIWFFCFSLRNVPTGPSYPLLFTFALCHVYVEVGLLSTLNFFFVNWKLSIFPPKSSFSSLTCRREHR